MKKILLVIGFIVWLELIYVGTISVLQNSSPNNIAALLFIVLIILVPIYIINNKNNKTKSFKKDKQNQKKLMCICRHISGLNFRKNTLCQIHSYSDKYSFISSSLQFNLAKNKVVDLKIESNLDTQKRYVASTGKAIVGGLLCGPIGAIIGGQAKEKTIKTIYHYMIFTYTDENNTYKDICFDVTNIYSKALKLVKEFNNTHKSVKVIDL